MKRQGFFVIGPFYFLHLNNFKVLCKMTIVLFRDEGFRVIEEMIAQVLALHPKAKHIHIGELQQ